MAIPKSAPKIENRILKYSQEYRSFAGEEIIGVFIPDWHS